jgi:hypothetical protein
MLPLPAAEALALEADTAIAGAAMLTPGAFTDAPEIRAVGTFT